jgi:hypothetical protein
MASDPTIYAGSASFFPGDTPFGFYDNDTQFQYDAEKMANYCARRLGYPVVEVELNELQFFSAFEAAITEYGNQVNTYSARDNILNLMGFDTGSQDINQKYVEPTLRGLFRLAKQYGSEVGVGGNLTWFSGSISLEPNKQVYDLISDATIETGSFSTDAFTIRKVFHEATPSIMKYFDPHLGTGLGSQQFLSQFGWGGFSAPMNFLLMPMHYDLLRMQAIEFNDQIRKSGYSFKLTNNRLRIFPVPRQEMKLWFNYTLDAEAGPGGIGGQGTDGDGKISDHSNIPYGRLVYRHVNEIGRQWIRKYTLAICKEMLGYIRGKHQNIPVPDDDTTLNHADLISAAENEKTQLIEELREMLDQMSRQSQLERKQAEADVLAQQLAKVPLKIYIG